jgi:hypothetical protein
MGTLLLLGIVGWIVYVLFLSPGNASTQSRSSSPVQSAQYLPALKSGLETTCHLAGVPHCIGDKSAAALKRFSRGQTLNPVRERHNAYDSLAIMLELNGSKVGYVPRACNREHAVHIDAGGKIAVCIISVDVSDPWQGVTIKVRNL